MLCCMCTWALIMGLMAIKCSYIIGHVCFCCNDVELLHGSVFVKDEPFYCDEDDCTSIMVEFVKTMRMACA